MARRKKQTVQVPFAGMLATVLALAVFAAAIAFARQLLVIFLVLIGSAFGIVVLLITIKIARRNDRSKAQSRMLRQADEIIRVHVAALSRKRQQLIWHDVYGQAQRNDWHKEKDRFITQVVVPVMSPTDHGSLDSIKGMVVARIDLLIDQLPDNTLVQLQFCEEMSGVEFESFCANSLQLAGWTVHATKKSHDQGTDLIAERESLRVVVQCKRYSRPVGNKAVQEVATAKLHEGADKGVVVSNNTFTKSARQLAATTGVELVHFSQLQDLYALLRN